MRAVTISRFGGPEVLSLTDLPVPDPGPGQVSIDVSHAAVGLADVLMRRGEFGGQPPLVPGLEVAGTVRAVGPGVDRLQPGQLVVTLSRPSAGGYAEVSLADAAVTVALNTSAADLASVVATVPNAATALLALTTVAPLASGGRLLVHGALGALSLIMAQVGRHLGAEQVIGTVRRPEQRETALRNGYDEVLVATSPEGVLDDLPAGTIDVVIDPVGGPLRRQSLPALAPLGRLVCVGNASGDQQEIQFGGNELWMANAAVLGLNAGGLWAQHPDLAQATARRALKVLEAGAVSAEVMTLPLAQARQAHERLEQGGIAGRLVLTTEPTYRRRALIGPAADALGPGRRRANGLLGNPTPER